MKGKDVKFAGIELTPSKHFVKAVGRKQKGFHKLNSAVGNAPMHDEALMDAALRRAMKQGFTTIRIFMVHANLKYHSAQRYLDSLCAGENAKLRRMKISGCYHYFPLKE